MSHKLKSENQITQNDMTTIWISKSNHKKLLNYGSMHMSMNEVIEKILSHQTGAYKTEIQEEGRDRAIVE